MPPIDLEDLAGLPDVFNPTASPSGDAVAFYWDVTGRNELYLLDADTGETRRLTDGEAPKSAVWPLEWGGAGDRVYFHRDEDGDEQHDLVAVDRDGAVETVVAQDGQCVAHDAGPDGRYLLFTSTAGGQMDLYRHDVHEDTTEQLTDSGDPIRQAAYGPDGEHVAFTRNGTDDPSNCDCYVARADGSEQRKLPVGEPGSTVGLAEWEPAGLLVSDDATGVPRPGLYDPDAEAVEWFGGDHEERPAAVGPDGERVLAVRTRRAAKMPVLYGPDGERELDVSEGVTFDAGFLDASTAFVLHATPTENRTLLRYDLTTDATETLVAPEYGDVDPGAFVDAEYVTYESVDGLEIGALLYDPGERPAPGVVRVHGGPQAQATRAFSVYSQFLASRGYAVLAPNYRGSTGRGREFRERLRGDWGAAEQADVAMAGEWLKDRGWVDEGRVAVMGASYGGYSAYMQLVCYPTTWAAVIANVGMTDLLALYEESMPHFETALEEQVGDPETEAELYRRRSAITHVENAEAPLLMLHGVNDPRCPISQARLFRDALEDRRGWTQGEQFEYRELGEEGHGSTDADYRTRFFRLVASFLDDRL